MNGSPDFVLQKKNMHAKLNMQEKYIHQRSFTGISHTHPRIYLNIANILFMVGTNKYTYGLKQVHTIHWITDIGEKSEHFQIRWWFAVPLIVDFAFTYRHHAMKFETLSLEKNVPLLAAGKKWTLPMLSMGPAKPDVIDFVMDLLRACLLARYSSAACRTLFACWERDRKVET